MDSAFRDAARAPTVNQGARAPNGKVDRDFDTFPRTLGVALTAGDNTAGTDSSVNYQYLILEIIYKKRYSNITTQVSYHRPAHISIRLENGTQSGKGAKIGR